MPTIQITYEVVLPDSIDVVVKPPEVSEAPPTSSSLKKS